MLKIERCAAACIGAKSQFHPACDLPRPMGFAEYQPHQIVFLEYEDKRLYTEVIQTVTDRGLCWARPLVMLMRRSDTPFAAGEPASEVLLDLRQGSDLLLPLSWFQIAVDTEVIPVLAQLNESKPEPALAPDGADTFHDQPSAQEYLQQFIREICQNNQPR